MLKWCWIVGVFSFHCVHCWDKLHAAWNSNAGTGVRVNIIIPWGKPPWFLRNLEKFFCHFPLGGFFEDILRMLPSSWTSPLQFKMLPHFWDPQVQHHLLTASYFGDLRRGLGTVVGVVNTPGRVQTLLLCSSPESPSCHKPGPALCPWCLVGHWNKVTTLHYGALKANHFLLRQWVDLEFILGIFFGSNWISVI